MNGYQASERMKWVIRVNFSTWAIFHLLNIKKTEKWKKIPLKADKTFTDESWNSCHDIEREKTERNWMTNYHKKSRKRIDNHETGQSES